MAYKITLKDFAIRSVLDIWTNIRHIIKLTKKGTFTIPSNYTRRFFDDFKSGYTEKWGTGGTQWAQPYHPDQLWQWFDDEQINQWDEGISLCASLKPRYFPEINKTIPNAIGVLYTKAAFKYGIFKFVAQLPKGTYLWPALWLCGEQNWPPEIDILEGYSNNTDDFEKNTNLQSNVHFKHDTEHWSIGGRKHRLPNIVTDEFIEYTVWWEMDFIKIYYNGYLVRYITDKKVLNQVSEKQYIIINNGTVANSSGNNLTTLIVKSVEVFKA